MKKIFENLKKNHPLIHNITNYVTVNDCANILLACGAAPIMADDVEEVEEMTRLCAGLNLNIGTLNQRTIPAMLLAGKEANRLGHPVVLDPVGAGATALRTQTALDLMKNLDISVIRGNISEIKTLGQGSGRTQGVDANVADRVTEENLAETIRFAQEMSRTTGAVIGITGEIDLVCDKNQAYVLRNGHSRMASVTGTGCMLSALICAFVAANPQDLVKATATAICAMGICGELAAERLTEQEGTGSYRAYILDAMSILDENTLEKRGKCEIRG